DLAPEVDERALRAELGLAAGAPLLALLPGSRPAELDAHAPAMVEAARRLRAARPALAAALALAPALRPGAALARACAAAGVRVVEGRTRGSPGCGSGWAGPARRGARPSGCGRWARERGGGAGIARRPPSRARARGPPRRGVVVAGSGDPRGREALAVARRHLAHRAH